MTTATAPTATAANGALEKVMEFVPYASRETIKLTTAIVRGMLCVPTRTGVVCDDVQAMRFMMLCRSRQLNPFEGDAYLIGYDSDGGAKFNLVTAHQAFLKRADTNPHYDGMDSGVVVKNRDGEVLDREGDFFFDDDTLLGAWAVVYHRARSHPTKRRLKLATFRKPFGRWKEDPAGMIVKCAEADALRSTFPTLYAGMYLEEELAPPAAPRPAAPPPSGRVRLGHQAPAAVAPEAPPPEPPAPTEDQARAEWDLTDWEADHAERLAQAETAAELDALAEEARARDDALGPQKAAAVRAALARRREQLQSPRDF